MNEPDRISAKISRHEELDVLRGGLLTYMAINHVPCATWPVTRHPFGFMAAAEGFVLLAGLLIGLIYTRKHLRDGAGVATRLLLKRAGKIYLAHLLCIAGVLVWMGVYAVATGTGRPPVGSPWAFFQQPVETLVATALLIHQPGLLDVLPLYCGLVLTTPLVLDQLMRGRTVGVLVVSAAIWVFANLVDAPEPLVRGVLNTGAFNFGAWQFLYFLGVVAGHQWSKGAWPRALRPSSRLGWITGAGLGLAILCSFGVFTFGLGPETWAAWTNKNNLAPIRIVNIALAALLVWSWLGPRAGAEASPRPRPRLRCAPLALMGRHSLPVFSVHVVAALAILGLPDWFEWSAWGPWAAPLLLVGAMLATARVAEGLATRRKAALASPA